MSESASTAPSYGPTTAPPPTYLAWAVVATLLCFLPLGVVAIVFATQVSSKYAAGDYAGAQAASDRARRWALWSTLVGVLLWVVLVVLVVAGVFVRGTTSASY